MSHLVPVREYTDAGQLLADIAARKRRLFSIAPASKIDDPEDYRAPSALPEADIKSMPRRMWDSQEVGTLRLLIRSGLSRREIASKLNRSIASVEFKGWSLGLEFRRIARPPPAPVELPPKRDWLKISVQREEPRKAPWRLIAAVVSKETEISLDQVCSAIREAPVVRARQLTCLLMHRHTVLSLSEIGTRVGHRDHTTVLHSVRKLERLSRTDAALDNMIAALTAAINAKAPAPEPPQPEEAA